MDFVDLADYNVKIKENEKRNKYLDLTREVRKLWNMRVTVIPIVNGAHEKIPQKFRKGTRRVGNRRTNRDHPDDSIVENGQTTEKTVCRLDSNKKNYQLMLM